MQAILLKKPRLARNVLAAFFSHLFGTVILVFICWKLSINHFHNDLLFLSLPLGRQSVSRLLLTITTFARAIYATLEPKGFKFIAYLSGMIKFTLLIFFGIKGALIVLGLFSFSVLVLYLGEKCIKALRMFFWKTTLIKYFFHLYKKMEKWPDWFRGLFAGPLIIIWYTGCNLGLSTGFSWVNIFAWGTFIVLATQSYIFWEGLLPLSRFFANPEGHLPGFLASFAEYLDKPQSKTSITKNFGVFRVLSRPNFICTTKLMGNPVRTFHSSRIVLSGQGMKILAELAERTAGPSLSKGAGGAIGRSVTNSVTSSSSTSVVTPTISSGIPGDDSPRLSQKLKASLTASSSSTSSAASTPPEATLGVRPIVDSSSSTSNAKPKAFSTTPREQPETNASSSSSSSSSDVPPYKSGSGPETPFKNASANLPNQPAESAGERAARYTFYTALATSGAALAGIGYDAATKKTMQHTEHEFQTKQKKLDHDRALELHDKKTADEAKQQTINYTQQQALEKSKQETLEKETALQRAKNESPTSGWFGTKKK